jgi:osmotically-inducible protein OsmY
MREACALRDSVSASKDVAMDIPKRSEIVSTPSQFAEGNTADGHDLQCRIQASLTNRVPELKRVRVTVFGGTVALRGEVRSLRDKRLCLECCREVSGVIRVVDDLLVIEES